jgi:hypothetical protein
MSSNNQADNDNHANQCNPNNDEYYQSRGTTRDDYSNDNHDSDGHTYSQADLDNYANQCNPNNDAYHSSRR